MTESTKDRPVMRMIVDQDPQVHSGDLVFAGTRVPVATLVDHLKRDRGVEEFLEGYPSVERWQVEAFLDLSSQAVENLLRAEHAHPPR
jgi:uncharacterized protein (DUF433 family)